MLTAWGRAKGAAKASCGETVVQKGVFGESVSSLPPQGFEDLSGILRENLKGAEKKRTLQKHPFGQPFLRTTPSPLLWRILTVGSFLLTVELFYLQLTFLASLLTVGAFSLTVLAFLLTVGAFLLTVGECV